MDYRQLGRTGLKVSPLCLGTMNFGPETTEPDSFAIMDRALERGVNFFDTANVYGWKLGEGITENIVGRWFAQGGGRRDKVVIATKVYGEMSKWPNHSRLSALAIRKACEDSLVRLKTDRIDLYQMHHVDRATPWEEIWQAMDVLVQQGKVIYVGSSNFAGRHIAQANEIARTRGALGPQEVSRFLDLTPVRVTELGGHAVGARVFHQKFGYGSVTAVEGDRLTIDFDKAGRKRVVDSFVTPATRV